MCLRLCAGILFCLFHAVISLQTCPIGTGTHAVPRWSANLPLPMPNSTQSFHGAFLLAQSQGQENCIVNLTFSCTTREDPLYIIHNASKVHAYLCRCKTGFKRVAGKCTVCVDELCPRYSDVGIAQTACTVPAPMQDLTPSSVTHLRDPLRSRPCRVPIAARFAPAVPFFFDARTAIVGTEPLPLAWCPPGQEYSSSGNRAWRHFGFTEDTSELRVRVAEPLLARMPFSLQDDLDVTGGTYAFEGGRTWVKDPSRKCVPCTAGFYCRDGVKSACPNASIIIGAGAEHECASPSPVPQLTTPCPSGAARRGPDGACVCLGDLLPEKNATLRAGFVCAPRHRGVVLVGPHMVRNGSVVRGPRAIAYWHGGDVVVDDLDGQGPRTVWTRTIQEWEIAGLGLTHVFLFARDGVHVVREGVGLVETVSVPFLSAVYQTRNLTVQGGAQLFLALRWQPVENSTDDATPGPLTELLQRGTVQGDGTILVTEQDYTAVGIRNLSTNTDLRVLRDGTVYTPRLVFAEDFKDLNTSLSFAPRQATDRTEVGWALDGYEVQFEADLGRGALVHRFHRADNQTLQAFTAVCFGDAERRQSTFVFADAKRACDAHLLAWKIAGLEAWACLNTTDCTWQPGTQRTLHADLRAGDILTQKGQDTYRLGRSTLLDAVQRGRMFGERVTPDGRVADVGWWQVRMAKRSASCHAPHAVWVDGECRECPFGENCKHHAVGVACREQSGCGACPCAPGFRAKEDGRCQICEAGDTFCKFGREHACPPNSATLSAGSTQCVCRAGFFGGAGDCKACPLGYECKERLGDARLRVPCPGNRSTEESGGDCLCRPGSFLHENTCQRCELGKYTLEFNQYSECKECTAMKNSEQCPCPLERGQVFDAYTQNCTTVCLDAQLSAGFYVNTHKHECMLCPPGWFCQHGQRTQCPHGMSSPPGARESSACRCTGGNRVRVRENGLCICKRGTYDNGGVCAECPANSMSLFGARSISECFCRAGFFRQSSECVLCLRGHYCEQNTTNPVPCPPGTFAPGLGLESREQCLPCSSFNKGQSGMWHPLACSDAFRSFRVHPGARPFLNAHRPRFVADLGTTLSSVPSMQHVDVEISSLQRSRIQLEARPEFVDYALLEIRDEHENRWGDLQKATENHHVLAYTVAVASFFCLQMRHELDSAQIQDAKCQVPLAVSEAHPVLQQADFFGQDVSILPETSQFFHDLSMTLGAQGSSTMFVLPVGSDDIIVADVEEAGREILQAKHGFPTRYYAMTEARGCRQTAESFLQECLRGTVHAVGSEGCGFCSEGEYFDTEAQECKVCETLGTCPFGGTACCGTSRGQCLFQQRVSDAELCLNGEHDLGESCDPTDVASPLASCCTETCELKTGFSKIGDRCGTTCGDNIVAVPDEDCDDYGDLNCDMRTCKFFKDV